MDLFLIGAVCFGAGFLVRHVQHDRRDHKKVNTACRNMVARKGHLYEKTARTE